MLQGDASVGKWGSIVVSREVWGGSIPGRIYAVPNADAGHRRWLRDVGGMEMFFGISDVYLGFWR